MDPRFRAHGAAKGLSKWVRGSIIHYDNQHQQLANDLGAFFERARVQFPTAAPRATKKRRAPIILDQNKTAARATRRSEGQQSLTQMTNNQTTCTTPRSGGLQIHSPNSKIQKAQTANRRKKQKSLSARKILKSKISSKKKSNTPTDNVQNIKPVKVRRTKPTKQMCTPKMQVLKKTDHQTCTPKLRQVKKTHATKIQPEKHPNTPDRRIDHAKNNQSATDVQAKTTKQTCTPQMRAAKKTDCSCKQKKRMRKKTKRKKSKKSITTSKRIRKCSKTFRVRYLPLCVRTYACLSQFCCCIFCVLFPLHNLDDISFSVTLTPTSTPWIECIPNM